jgi:pSer/pThr/pTyr-binding forkhead associated (FHA) protein
MLILVLSEEGQSQTLQLSQDLISVGRSRENIIVVRSKKASRAHAKIERIGSTYQITDLGSGNGTKVNGSKIDFHTLAAGDEIKIGDATLLLKSIDDEISDDSADEDANQTDLSDKATELDANAAPAEDDLTFKDEPPETEIMERPGPKAKPAAPATTKALPGARPAAAPAKPPTTTAPRAAPPAAPPGAKPRPSLNDRFKKKQ